MNELEQQLASTLNPARARRLEWLVAGRQHLAEVAAQLTCAGLWDFPPIDRQMVLLERAITAMTTDTSLAASLLTRYVVDDAALIHAQGNPPAGLTCAVCEQGHLSLDALAFPIRP